MEIQRAHPISRLQYLHEYQELKKVMVYPMLTITWPKQWHTKQDFLFFLPIDDFVWLRGIVANSREMEENLWDTAVQIRADHLGRLSEAFR